MPRSGATSAELEVPGIGAANATEVKIDTNMLVNKINFVFIF